jgi:hypothetical protein
MKNSQCCRPEHHLSARNSTSFVHPTKPNSAERQWPIFMRPYRAVCIMMEEPGGHSALDTSPMHTVRSRTAKKRNNINKLLFNLRKYVFDECRHWIPDNNCSYDINTNIIMKAFMIWRFALSSFSNTVFNIQYILEMQASQ